MSDLYSILLPEEILLLHLCHLTYKEQHKKKIRDLAKKVDDWDRFVTLANHHGIIALCWFNIIELNKELHLPTKVMGQMYSGYLKSLTRNTKIFELLKKIKDIALKDNIKIVLLKGLALEISLYGNKGIRQMNDLDILVNKKDAIKLRKLLLKNGFESPPMISPLHERIIATYGKHLPEMHKDGLSIELHINLFNETRNYLTENIITGSYSIPDFGSETNSIDLEYSLANSLFKTKPKEIPGVYFPDNQLHFLYLVKHLQSHESDGVSQLRLYVDLILLLEKKGEFVINKGLIEFSKICNLSKPLSEKLFLLREIWIEDLSFSDFSIEEPAEKEKVVENFIHFLRNPKEMKNINNPLNIFGQLREITKLSHKLVFLIGCLFPSISFMKYRYNLISTIKTFLYYPIRWLQLFKLFTPTIYN